MPPFLGFFCFFFGVESWAVAHGLFRCTVYRLLSEPMSTRLLNSISSRICRQNTQFNMYTTTSKQQEGCTLKDSHPKCFITTNFDKFHREAFARGGDRGDVLTACFRDIQSQRSIRMAFVIKETAEQGGPRGPGPPPIIFPRLIEWRLIIISAAFSN